MTTIDKRLKDLEVLATEIAATREHLTHLIETRNKKLVQIRDIRPDGLTLPTIATAAGITREMLNRIK